ncbi:hypothetical protein BUE80_DR007322 [Diplocarpon rosae]|nr:hypothetical protein BUE80_DR007322 [Diplocarpon rosae]
MGPGNNLNYTPHALRRDFSPSLALERLNSSVIQWLQDADSFALYARRSQSVSPGLDGVFTHGGGHFGVGGLVGELSNTYSSPGDPIFWLHHGHIDYLWNEWQRRNWTIRKDEITGPDVMFGYPWNYFGDPAYTNVTLNTTMDFGPFGREITIASLMDISGGLLGYEYS